MSTQQTPGGWKVQSVDGRFDVLRPLTPEDRKQYKIPDNETRGMSILMLSVENHAVIESLDTARLIASAPELLQALEELVPLYEDARAQFHGLGALARARAAIAAAKGETQP